MTGRIRGLRMDTTVSCGRRCVSIGRTLGWSLTPFNVGPKVFIALVLEQREFGKKPQMAGR